MLLVRWAMDQAWAAAAPAAMGISVHPDKGPKRNLRNERSVHIREGRNGRFAL